MKKLSIFFAFLFMSAFTFAQTTEGSKTLVKTLDPGTAGEVIFDFKHKSLDAKHWEHKGIRIQLEIHTNMPEAIMGQLVKAGRYTLNGIAEENIYRIVAPNLEKSVTIGGKALEEEIIIHADLPDYIRVENGNIQLFSARGLNNTMDIEIKFVYLETAVATSTNTQITKTTTKTAETTTKVAEAEKTATLAAPTATAPMTAKEISSLFGEILIDGVKFEVE